MMKFEEYFAQEFADIQNEIEVCDANYAYFAYKNGVALEFETKKLAMAFSHNVERFDKNKDKRALLVKEKTKLKEIRYSNWKADLRNNFPKIRDEQFSILFDKVRQEEPHYDEYLDEIGDLYELILEFNHKKG